MTGRNGNLAQHLIELLRTPSEAIDFVEACLRSRRPDFVPREDVDLQVCVAGFLAGPALEERCAWLLKRFVESARTPDERMICLNDVHRAKQALRIASGHPRWTALVDWLWPGMSQALQQVEMGLREHREALSEHEQHAIDRVVN